MVRPVFINPLPFLVMPYSNGSGFSRVMRWRYNDIAVLSVRAVKVVLEYAQ